jgi:hypothetical protein
LPASRAELVAAAFATGRGAVGERRPAAGHDRQRHEGIPQILLILELRGHEQVEEDAVHALRRQVLKVIEDVCPDDVQRWRRLGMLLVEQLGHRDRTAQPGAADRLAPSAVAPLGE